MYVLKTDFICG
jgi:histone acetyltransferase 1